MPSHIIDRTSPTGPGFPFIGTCRLCGVTGLTFKDIEKNCPGNKLSADETVVEAIAPQDHTFPGKRGDQVLNAVDHVYGEKIGALTMRDIYDIVVEKLERNITIKGQEVDSEAIGQMVCVEIERKLGIFPNYKPLPYYEVDCSPQEVVREADGTTSLRPLK